MKEKIVKKAADMFLKLGFKSVTMDDIACEMCISKKTIYKYFANKELLIQEGTKAVQEQTAAVIESVLAKNYNAIEENFEIKKMFRELFKATESSPLYQLKKHYIEIYHEVISRQIKYFEHFFTHNIQKGIEEGLYRNNIKIENYVKFYYLLIFSINENTAIEKEVFELENYALEYHIRAMSTPKGLIELEKHL